MIVADTVAALRAAVAHARHAGRRVAFVPTMGNLHAGHAHLFTAARAAADFVVASIYVNPLQFGPREDFANYPRTPAEDHAVLRAAGVDAVFTPDDGAMYPRGREASTRVSVPGVGEILCGAARPGHFTGVTTVVNRLFNLVAPDVALFGKKDYQQLLLIKLMTQDLGMPIEIIGVETVRADDGLALSSRNGYLTAPERARAPQLYAQLRAAKQALLVGVAVSEVERAAEAALATAGFAPDYVSVRRQADLAVPGAADAQLVILAAARLGRARLIDNLELDLNLRT